MSDINPSPDDKPPVAPPNPFQPTPADTLPTEADFAPPLPTPRLWPAFAVVIGAILAALAVSGTALVIAAAATGNLQAMQDRSQQQSWLAAFGSTPIGLFVLVIPGQFVFAASAMGAALLSRERWVDRLGLGMGRLPMWSWLLLLIGTPVIGMFSAQLLSQLADRPSDQMQLLEQMFQFDSIGSLLVLLMLVSLLPGIVEEILFRGYMQRRLLVRLPAVASILICSLFFSAAHMDPLHALGVFPLGLWLGVIAWRADSIWPAIFAHIGNNAYAIVLTQVMGSDPDLEDVSPAVGIILGLTLMAFIASVIVLSIPRHDELDVPEPVAPELLQ